MALTIHKSQFITIHWTSNFFRYGNVAIHVCSTVQHDQVAPWLQILQLETPEIAVNPRLPRRALGPRLGLAHSAAHAGNQAPLQLDTVVKHAFKRVLIELFKQDESMSYILFLSHLYR
jgi:hypothetical protein